MSTLNGLPAHVLLVHFIVVLTPLTALLAVVCALWSAARTRLIWLVVALSAGVALLTPLTMGSGEWLEHNVGRSAAAEAHAELGDTMIYFSVVLLAAVALLAAAHVRKVRDRAVKPVAVWMISVFVLLASVAATVQVYRIGDSGARAAWGQEVAADQP